MRFVSGFRWPVALTITGFIALAMWSFVMTLTASHKTPESFLAKASVSAAEAERDYANGDLESSKSKLKRLVSLHSSSSDPKIQDVVAHARMRLGYIAANQKDFNGARKSFQEASQLYRGTGVKDISFGRLDDQAAYQSAVCLQADGKAKEAIAEYVQFLKERPESPLTNAVWRRLMKLNPGNEKRYTELLNSAVSQRETAAKKEVALCGPKSLAEFLRRQRHEVPDEKELVKLCKTDLSGTSIASLQSALSKFGYSSKGYQMNLADFSNLSRPAFWLTSDHFVLYLGRREGKALVYDPLTSSETFLPLPKLGDSFNAAVLVPEPRSTTKETN